MVRKIILSKVYKKLRKELADINKLYFKDKESKKTKIYVQLRKQKYKELTDLLGEYGINEYSLINKMTPMYKSFNKNIDNKTAQALASRSWKALEKLIFKDAQKVNFIRYDELNSPPVMAIVLSKYKVLVAMCP